MNETRVNLSYQDFRTVIISLRVFSGIFSRTDVHFRPSQGINERSVIVGEVFTAPKQTLYTRWGDWFGWLMVVGLVAMIGLAVARRKYVD